MPETQWISHRGRCFPGAENTLEAFRYARQAGFSHFETDLRITADRHIVLCHDIDLQSQREDDVPTPPIHQCTLKELRHFTLRANTTIMTLAELIQEFTQYQWIFDIKPEHALETIDVLLDTWWCADWTWFFQHNVRFLFWDIEHQQHLLKRRKHARVMANAQQCWRSGLCCLTGLSYFADLQVNMSYALPPRIGPVKLYKPSLIQKYHARNAQVLAYLPATQQDAADAMKAGVDEILTDGLPLPPAEMSPTS